MSTSTDETFSGVKAVEDRHKLDEAALARWLQAHVEGYAGPLEVFQFKGGQSNPTYRLDTPTHRYVLRRKPFGKLLPSAHAVDREYKVITALHGAGFAAPRTYGLCADDTVIGAMFYVMDMVPGRIFWDATLPTLPKPQRAAYYTAEVETLAQLHSYEPAAIGLGDFGKPGNYFARQIDRWTKQYRASETERIEAMERLIAFLPATVPAQQRVSLVHGDYRLDNMIFHASEPKVIAVLDWELSTLGDPLADFTYFLMTWVMPPAEAGSAGSRGLAGLDLPTLGIPDIPTIVAQYCQLTGRSGLPDLDWYFAYNLFRLAAILQGIAGRVRDGTAASAQALEAIRRIRPLADSGWSYAERAGA
jgi:aminoglycoside phosphotransferase (APT) family kinase protein